MSLAEHQPRWLKCLPKQFQDIVPQPLPLLPPVLRPPNDDVMLRAPFPPASNEPQSAKCSLGSHIHQIFQTPKNMTFPMSPLFMHSLILQTMEILLSPFPTKALSI